MAEWWRGAVVYQIYPRSFFDTNGDGVGDLAGVTEHLYHVAALGADAVWLSPFFRSPMKDFGYDVEDYRAVDPLFGALADVDRLLERAHALGLRVLIDMVLSHTSDRHAWFRESRQGRGNPKSDWYVWADPKPDGTPPNNWLSVFGGPAWTWDSRRRQYYLHNFLPGQPDLNLHNRAVQDAVLAECAFWLERGVDGFRLDVANYYLHDRLLRDNPARAPDAPWPDGVPPGSAYGMQVHRHDKSQPETVAVLRRLRGLLDRYPDRMAVAEVHDDDSVARAAEYVAAPDRLHTAYNFALLGPFGGAAAVRRAVEAFERQPGRGWPSWAFSNHDTERVASRWAGPEAPPAAARLFLALLTSLRGTAFLYQGEELGLPQAEVPYDRLRDPFGIAMWPEAGGRDGCRTPMPWTAEGAHAGFSPAEPWLPIPDAHRARAVDVQRTDPDSVLSFARGWLAWRKRQPALRLGDIRFRDLPEPLLAFERRHEEQRLLCVFNLGPRAVEAPLADAERWQALAGHGLPGALSDGVLHLPGWGGVVVASEEQAR
ncbi:alpha-glucosidase family protein [Azospirillum sp. TSO22-1]|uniref:alpha-glucosidase family protein n=1 Tax=Azospirillum sp. TSO22-1 TaxID=716789 RepID=UPI000D618DA2|nr:alpha-glucosidase family protein [Azospirillum sp. TSO22-1]PWC56357.1 alpha-glucosidase [Azospirillum sp. TSO22-1]